MFYNVSVGALCLDKWHWYVTQSFNDVWSSHYSVNQLLCYLCFSVLLFHSTKEKAKLCRVLLPKVMIPNSYIPMLGHRVHTESFELQAVPKMHHCFPSLCLREVCTCPVVRLFAIRTCPNEKPALAGRLWAVCRSNRDRWNLRTHPQLKLEYLTIDLRDVLQTWKESCVRIQNVQRPVWAPLLILWNLVLSV